MVLDASELWSVSLVGGSNGTVCRHFGVSFPITGQSRCRRLVWAIDTSGPIEEILGPGCGFDYDQCLLALFGELDAWIPQTGSRHEIPAKRALGRLAIPGCGCW